jgi:hypothetical protein
MMTNIVKNGKNETLSANNGYQNLNYLSLQDKPILSQSVQKRSKTKNIGSREKRTSAASILIEMKKTDGHKKRPLEE